MKCSKLVVACLLISTHLVYAEKAEGKMEDSIPGVEEITMQQKTMLEDDNTKQLVRKSLSSEKYIPPCHYEYIRMLNACYVYQRMRDEDTCCISKTIDYNTCFEKLPREIKMRLTGYSYYK
jgi:hypothetical protein